MAICEKCGNPLILNGGKCVYCGATEDGKPPRSQRPPEKPHKHWWWILAVVVVLVAVLFWCLRPTGIEPMKNQEDLVFNVKGVKFTMKPVEGGTFHMGSDDEWASDYEKPIHKVTVSSFYMCETEVTQALWTAVYGSTIEEQREKWKKESRSGDDVLRGKGGDYPMYYVNWVECQEFIRLLNSLTGENFRLPTEAEWEYAARGGKYAQGYLFSGSNNVEDVAWYRNNSGDKYLSSSDNPWVKEFAANNNQTHRVKTKKANELGIYDMSGNVMEWCIDCFDTYGSRSQTDPKCQKGMEGKEHFHVLRGGCWMQQYEKCRVSHRAGMQEQSRGCVYAGKEHSGYYCGFRLVLSRYNERR